MRLEAKTILNALSYLYFLQIGYKGFNEGRLAF